MKIIGLTGGIGSGKTTIAKLFKEKGIPVFEADKAAKKILAEDPEAISEVKKLLGEKAYDKKESPDRKFIASKVFNSQRLLDGLNSIIHPKVHHCFNQWKSTQDAAYLIYEAAIIFEHGSENQFDYTILVVADREEKIKRVMSRDSVTKKEVEGRMKNQWDDQKKLKKADFVIENNSLVKATLKVEEIHKNLSG